MVEHMDHDDDVERLFSWIKTPDLRYREFAGEREVADAVATWPALRKTADETGRADDASAEPAPAAEPEPPPTAASGRSPLGERLASIFGQRDPAVPQAEPVFRHIETPEPPAPASVVPWEPEAPPPSPPPAATPQERRENPFGGTYRGFENEEEVEPPPALSPPQASPPQASPPEAPPADPNARSLDAVFSRLARPAQRYRDERQRAAGGSGLGPVFRRLR
ncbi:MAG TPA: hypothetical protein VFW46_13745 [Stellaceae bacterium]|nr:hypothetical protein [Stellaceae bacterium]